MKFTVERKVESNVFSVTITHKEYGTNSLDAETEKGILDSFSPVLAYSDITFSDNYTVSGSDVVKGGSDTIKLALNNRKVNIDSTFSVTYRIDASSIAKSEFSSFSDINSREKLAQAQCKLFQDKVVEKLGEILTATRAMNNDFTKTEEITK